MEVVDHLGKILQEVNGNPPTGTFGQYEAMISRDNPDWRRDNKQLLISLREQKTQPLTDDSGKNIDERVEFLTRFNAYLVAVDREESRALLLVGSGKTLEQAWPEYKQ